MFPPRTFASSAVVTEASPGQDSATMLLKQVFGVPLLAANVVVNVPEPSGHRPKLVAAC